MVKSSNWVGLYEDNLVQRALMDMASANAIRNRLSSQQVPLGEEVFRVNNGSLNVSPKRKGKTCLILQKFKQTGKKVGCVTTVPITHATPAGFCVTSKRRNAMDHIAEQYVELNFDVMMGGGSQYFDKDKRKDKKDVFDLFAKKDIPSQNKIRNAQCS